MTGDGLVRPLNAPPAGAVATGVQPGISNAVVTANRVIVYGAKGGIFVYSGTPAHGNLIYSISAAPGTDQYGNVFYAGAVSYAPGGALQVIGAQIDWTAGGVNYVDQQLTLGTPPALVTTPLAGNAVAIEGTAFAANAVVWYPPSGDTTGVKDQAALNAFLTTGQAVRLTPGQYWVNAPLKLGTGAMLDGGQGVISPAAGFTGTCMLELASGTTANTMVRDLWLMDTWTAAGVSGVNYQSANSVPKNRLRGVVCYGFAGSGFTLAATADTASVHATDCFAYGNLLDGFQLTSDQLVVNCEAGFNQGHGYHFLTGASNVYLSNCLAWYSGVDPRTGIWPTTGSSCGYFADQNSQYVRISNCWAQQNGLHGYAIGATSGAAGFAYQVAVTGGGADTNGAYGAGVTGHGVFISSGFSTTVTGVGGDNNGGLSPGSQQYGIFYAGNCSGSELTGNTITGSSGLLGAAAGASGMAGGLWQALALANGWAAGTGAAPQQRLLVSPPNTFQVIGTLNGAASTSAVFAQLPAAPASIQMFPLGDTTVAAAGQSYGQCDAAGNLSVIGSTLLNRYTFSGFISLDA